MVRGWCLEELPASRSMGQGVLSGRWAGIMMMSDRP